MPQFPEGYPARWPQYIPYPTAIRRGWRPVPNGSAVDWPSYQFAPPFLPPGSPSYQPYVFPDNGLMQNVPLYVLHTSTLNGADSESTTYNKQFAEAAAAAAAGKAPQAAEFVTPSEGWSTTQKVGAAVGGLALLGLIGWVVSR